MTAHSSRLAGLDLARYLAFVGMVIVNFKIAMGAEGGAGLLAQLTGALEGRAAATFVVLAGIGLGLSHQQHAAQTTASTVRRALVLLALGLLNMTVFEADILHYYAFYFLFGALLLPLGSASLAALVLGLNALFVGLCFTLDYDAGWDWQTYTYTGFWTPTGFLRNLMFNGWHPVVPWLGFLLFGILLSRMPLAERRTQRGLIAGGFVALALAEALSARLAVALATLNPGLALLAGTEPVPPGPLYSMAGIGAACIVVGACLIGAELAPGKALLRIVGPAGRQTLTLYLAHVLVGMGVLEAMDLLGGQSVAGATGAALLFCAAATVYALLWSRAFGRGPVEALLRRIAG